MPLDEHLFIERTGANRSYRRFRSRLRDYYRRNYPLTERARSDPRLNPGASWVSPLAVEPRVAVAVIWEELQPFLSSGRLTVVQPARPTAVAADGDRITGVAVTLLGSGEEVEISADYYLDATEIGELLALGNVEYATGREARTETGEPSAPETADPGAMQGVTWCFVVDHIDGGDFTIPRPAHYDRYRTLPRSTTDPSPLISLTRRFGTTSVPSHIFQPNPDDDPASVELDHRRIPATPDLWTYRRIVARRQFLPGTYASDVTVVNWPQNDYIGGDLFDVADAADHWRNAKELSQSLLYWLQTEAPRADGGTGWPGLRPRPDIAGTDDGFAMYPYIRESRRIRARTTILEQDVSLEFRPDGRARMFDDSVGVGHYYWIDRHAVTGGGSPSGFGALPAPFQIPLGALVPVRVTNLLPAAKNIGTTHLSNGCYRLHPVEWSIGEASISR